MNRRKFILGGGTVALAGMSGLAGCSVGRSAPESDDAVEAEIAGKVLWANHVHDGHPDGYSQMDVLRIYPDAVWLDEYLERTLEIDTDNLDQETRIAELPMGEIAAEIGLMDTFAEFALRLETLDHVNDTEPPEDDGSYHYYLAPGEFFDHLDLGETRQLRVAEPADSYGISGHGRIIDILD